MVEPDPVEATAVFQADEYAVEGDSVYYAQTDYTQGEQQAGYYGYSEPSYGQQYQQPYQEPYEQPYQYQEYAQYPEQQQYQQQYSQYAEQQQYAGYEQQAYPQQATYDQQHYCYYYEQAGYYTPDPQHHAPQG